MMKTSWLADPRVWLPLMGTAGTKEVPTQPTTSKAWGGDMTCPKTTVWSLDSSFPWLNFYSIPLPLNDIFLFYFFITVTLYNSKVQYFAHSKCTPCRITAVLRARYCTKQFICIILFHLIMILLKAIVLLSPFNRGANWGSERKICPESCIENSNLGLCDTKPFARGHSATPAWSSGQTLLGSAQNTTCSGMGVGHPSESSLSSAQ